MSVDINWSTLDDSLAKHVQDFLNKQFQIITKPSFIGDIEVTSFQWGKETPQVEIINITEPFHEFYEEEEDEEDNKQLNSNSSVSSTPISPNIYPNDYNTTRLSLNTPLSQQQRFNLMHSFHRSPFVAPQHPFNTFPQYNNNTSNSNSSSVAIEEDWIDDVEEDTIPPSNNTNTTHDTTTDTKSTEMDFQVHALISYKGDMNMTIMTELRMNYPSVMFMSLPIHLNVKSIEFQSTAVIAYIQSMNRVCVSMLEPETPTRGNNSIGMDR